MNYGQRQSNTHLKEDTGYKYVYAIINRSGFKRYEAKLRIKGKDTSFYYETARQAAKRIDMELLKLGKKQVNNTLVKKI